MDPGVHRGERKSREVLITESGWERLFWYIPPAAVMGRWERSDIFRLATRVRVWLGPALDAENRFWGLLESYVARGDFNALEFKDELDEFMQGDSNKLALGLNDLVRRPWFQRAWVSASRQISLCADWLIHRNVQTYQEIRLAVAVHVVCGGRFMPWTTFVDALDAFNKNCAFLRVAQPLRTLLRHQSALFKGPGLSQPSRARLPSDSSEFSSLNNKPSLLSLLVDVWARDASDPRDKIYAFTSHHLVSTYPELTPDYSLDTRCTFIRFVRIYINSENNLEFLKFAREVGEPLSTSNPRTWMDGNQWVRLPNLLHSSPTARQETASLTTPGETRIDLPSWVCDWRKQAQRPNITDLPGVNEGDYFSTRVKFPPIRQSIHDFSCRLVLRGCALARIGRHETEALGTFLTLPKCALKNALSRTTASDDVPRQFQLSEVFARGEGPPLSNMTLLLLNTLLHNESGCTCDDISAGRRNSEPVMDPRVLKARCQHAVYPRSRVCSLD